MDSLNSLLIIASAFSVFGQYIDTNHRNDIQAIKEKLYQLDLSDADHNSGMADVKTQWDDFMNSDCLRARSYVLSLFLYLILTVLFISVASGLSALGIWGITNNNKSWLILLFGVVLLIISVLMVWRLLEMGKERERAKENARNIHDLHRAVHTAIQSVKQQTPNTQNSAQTQLPRSNTGAGK